MCFIERRPRPFDKEDDHGPLDLFQQASTGSSTPSRRMTMPRCMVLNGNGTCVKTGVISVAYVTKMSHWVQIARPSNHGLDVVSQCKSSHLDRSSAYCHHSLFISDIWLLKSHFFRLKTRPCQGVCNCPMYSFGLATRHGRGLDSVRISSRS